MRNKRGDLVQNILTTIIAIIGIVLLIFAAWKLYSVYSSQEERNAQKLIDNIVGKIGAIEEGKSAKLVFGAVSKEENKWSLWGWGKSEEGRPDKCYFKSCICVCPFSLAKPGKDSPSQKGNAKEVCQTEGFCRLFDQSQIGVKSIQTTYRVFHSDLGSSLVPSGTSLAEGISLPSNLFEIEIEKRGKGEILESTKSKDICEFSVSDISSKKECGKIDYSKQCACIVKRGSSVTVIPVDQISGGICGLCLFSPEDEIVISRRQI